MAEGGRKYSWETDINVVHNARQPRKNSLHDPETYLHLHDLQHPEGQTRRKTNSREFKTPTADSIIEEKKEDEIEEEEEYFPSDDLGRVKKILVSAIPIFLNGIVQVFTTVVSSFFIGHYTDKVQQAAGGIADMWMYSFTNICLYGVSYAFTTICARDFGRKDYRSLGLNLHRGIVVTGTTAVFFFILTLFSGPILKAIGQDPVRVDIAQPYLQILNFVLLINGVRHMVMRFMEAHLIFDPPTIASIVALIFHPIICFVFFHLFGWGLTGAAVADLISFIINITVQLYIIRIKYWKEIERSLFWFEPESFRNYGECLKMAGNTMLSTCTEFWCAEIGGLMASYFGEASFVAHNSLYQLEITIFQYCCAVSEVVISLLGILTGKKNDKEMKHYIRVFPFAGFIGVAIISITLLFSKTLIGQLFSNDAEVIASIDQLTPIVVCFGLFDAAQNLLGAVVKGCGMYDLATKSNIIAFYFIGLPIAGFLAFGYDSGVPGIWTGLIVGTICIAFYYMNVIEDIDIKRVINDYHEQLAIEEKNRELGLEVPLVH